MEKDKEKISLKDKLISLKNRLKKIPFITKDSAKDFGMWVIVSIGLFLFLEYLSRRSSSKNLRIFLDKNLCTAAMNVLLVLMITGIIFFFKHKKAILWVISFVMLAVGVASRMVLEFRGMPLAFMDLYAIKDGASIASRFIDGKMIVIAVIVLLAFFAGAVILWKRDKNSKRFNGASNIAMWILSIVVYSVSIGPIKERDIMYNLAWDIQASYEFNGFVYSILDSYFGYLRKPPENYNKKTIAKIRAEVDKKEAEDKRVIKSEKDAPNILIVQLEGFMDPTTIPNLKISEDPIPNFRKLSKQNPSGFMNVPTTGGGTARTEFEVITGNNFDNLLSSEIPYTSIVKEKTSNSLATAMKKQGFAAHAIHNFKGNFYNRDKGFKNLGFDTFTSYEYMNGLEYTKLNWPKDYILTTYIKKAMDSTENKDFICTVSVQGHSKYPTKKVGENYRCKVSGKMKQEHLNQIYYYCEQIREMDEFIKQLNDMLIERKKKTGEDTVVIYYGDHMAKLDYIYDREEEIMDKYISPYTYFATYDISKNKEGIDEAYKAGMKLQQLAGVKYGPIEKLHAYLKDDKDYLEKIKLVEYDILFGEKYYLKDDEIQKENKMKMGLDEIKIKSAEIEGDKIVVEGEDFTASSHVFLNEKRLETTRESPAKLTAKIDGEIKEGDSITVKQLGDHDVPLSSTKQYKIK